MYFDEALWRALAGFVVATGGEVTTIEHGRRAGEIPLDQFLEIMTRTDPENREPPGAVLARTDGELVLAMVTDFWVDSGGPTPYHDSYTYAVFSHRDVSSEVMRALEDAEAFPRWRLGAVSDVPASRGRRSRAAPGPITSFFAAFLLSLRGR